MGREDESCTWQDTPGASQGTPHRFALGSGGGYADLRDNDRNKQCQLCCQCLSCLNGSLNLLLLTAGTHSKNCLPHPKIWVLVLSESVPQDCQLVLPLTSSKAIHKVVKTTVCFGLSSFKWKGFPSGESARLVSTWVSLSQSVFPSPFKLSFSQEVWQTCSIGFHLQWQPFWDGTHHALSKFKIAHRVKKVGNPGPNSWQTYTQDLCQIIDTQQSRATQWKMTPV